MSELTLMQRSTAVEGFALLHTCSFLLLHFTTYHHTFYSSLLTVTHHPTMVAPIISAMPAGTPLAALTTLDFQKLRSNDADEKLKLWKAATEAGFFYMNYENMPEFEDIATTVNGIYNLEHDVFDLSDEEKMQYDVDKQGNMKLSGYKPIGRNIGGLSGKRDGHESWAVSIPLTAKTPNS